GEVQRDRRLVCRVGRRAEVITGASRDKGDFMGMPVETGGTVGYSPPQWVQALQQAGNGVLVLDELQSSAESFAISMRIVQEKVVGEAELPAGTSIVAISNPVDEAVDGMELPAPVANRFMHTEWVLPFEDWTEGLVSDFTEPAGADVIRAVLTSQESIAHARSLAQGQVVAFLSKRPYLREAVPTDPAQAGKGWPSYRSWHNFIRVASYLPPGDEDARDTALIGLVGQAAATEFLAWLATSDLHDPAQVMDNPEIVDWHGQRPDRLFALITSVQSLALAGGKKRPWEQGMAVAVACAEGGKPDVAVPAARALLAHRPKGALVPEEARDAFGDLFDRAGAASRSI